MRAADAIEGLSVVVWERNGRNRLRPYNFPQFLFELEI
jgi:hypothetical protein